MQLLEALKLVAMHLRGIAPSSSNGADAEMLRQLARDIDQARCDWQSDSANKDYWKRVADGRQGLMTRLSDELAEAKKDRDWWRSNAELSVERQGRCLAENVNLRKKVRDLQKKLRAAKGGA